MNNTTTKIQDSSTTTDSTTNPFGSLAEVTKTNKIEPLNGSFCELGSLVATPTQSSYKDGPCIIPATFKNDIRCTEEAIECHFLGYDLDNLPDETDLEALTSCISSFSHVAYSTYSHKTEGKGNRYRVLLELDSPIPADEYSSFAANFAHRHLPSINTDKSCFSPIQPLLLPLVHPDRTSEYEYSFNTGTPLNWKKYIAKPDNIVVEQVKSSDLITEGNRNTSVFQHGINLLKHGTKKEAIFSHLSIFNQTYCIPPLDANEVMSISESVMASNIATTPREDKLTHLSLAKIAAESYGTTIRWVPHFNSWVSLDEMTYLWETVDESLVIGLMIAEIEKLRELEANLVRTSLSSTAARIKQIENAESRNFLKGAVDLLKSCNGINTDSREFDKNDLIVGLKNKQCLGNLPFFKGIQK